MDDQRAPVFVKVEEYRTVRELLESIKDKLSQAKTLIARVNELKQQEDAQIETWSRDIEDVEERLSSISRSLLEPQA